MAVKGSIVALVTPFAKDGSVDFGKLRELLDWHIENGTDGILMMGTTGENATTEHEEDEKICQFAIDHVAGRVPMIIGGGSNSTRTQMNKCIKYSKMGADALLCISPYYNKTNAEGMYRHFAEAADVSGAPIILYNVPGRTGCSIPVDVVARLSRHGNVMGIKEASGDIAYASEVARLLSDDFVMYSGNDDITVPLLALGGVGVISVWANIMPKTCHNMVMDYLQGRQKEALAVQLRYLDLIHALFMEVNPIPVKEAMNLMGMNVGGFRLPLYEMPQAKREKLAAIMREAGLKVQ